MLWQLRLRYFTEFRVGKIPAVQGFLLTSLCCSAWVNRTHVELLAGSVLCFPQTLETDLKLIVSGVLSLSALSAVLIVSSHVGGPFN